MQRASKGLATFFMDNRIHEGHCLTQGDLGGMDRKAIL